jgi:hypothetical protein
VAGRRGHDPDRRRARGADLIAAEQALALGAKVRIVDLQLEMRAASIDLGSGHDGQIQWLRFASAGWAIVDRDL